MSIHYTDNLNADIDNFLNEEAEAEENRPHCCECGGAIWEDTALYLDDEWYCEDCVHDHMRCTDNV